MILYHGSYSIVEKPDIAFSRDNTDFGKGFYTTPFLEQAFKWAQRFKRSKGNSVVSYFDLNEERTKQFSAKVFDSYSDEWLEFIISNRKGKSCGEYDIVIGGVANDKVFDCIELFLNGLIDKAEAIKRLRYETPNTQYCFRSQKAIDNCLKFLKSEAL